LIMVGHPHFFRYLVAYPGFLLELQWPDLGFGLYIALYFATNVRLWRRLLRQISLTAIPAWAWLMFLGAHLAMNGRGVIAWTAWLITACLCVEMYGLQTPVQSLFRRATIALLLASVSTGVFMVVATTLAVSYMHYRSAPTGVRIRTWKRALGYAVAIPVLYIAGDFFWVALSKNIDFYGGGLEGVVNMLSHGLGLLFVDFDISSIAVMVLAGVAAIVVTALSVGRRWTPIHRLMLYSGFGGLFGFTVLTLLLPVTLASVLSSVRLKPRIPPRGNT
jgi:hypothetical protein